MQFQIRSTALSDALNRLVAATDSKIKLPKNEYLRVEAYENSVRLSAYSGVFDAQAVLSSDVIVSEPFEVGVQKEMLASIVKSLPDCDVTFKVQGPHAELKTNASAFKVNLLSDLSVLPQLELSLREYGELDVASFTEGLRRVSYCHNDQPLQPYHNQLYIDNDLFVSTDGLRMALYPNRAFGCPSFMLLRIEDMRRAQKMLSGLTAKGGIGSDGSCLYLAAGGLYASARLVVGSYPNFKAILPTDVAPSVQLPRREMIDSVKRVMIVIQDPIGAVEIEFTDQAVVLSCLSATGSTSREVLDNALCRPLGRTKINGKFLLDALTSMDKDEVTVEYRGPNKPIIVTDGEHRNVIQPIGNY